MKRSMLGEALYYLLLAVLIAACILFFIPAGSETP